MGPLDGRWITLRSTVTTVAFKAGVIWAGVVALHPDLSSRAGAVRARRRGPRCDRRRAGRVVVRGPALAHRPRRASAASRANPPRGHRCRRAPTWPTCPARSNFTTARLTACVPFGFSETLVTQIEAVGGDVTLFGYPGDDHNISANLRRRWRGQYGVLPMRM
ncbi:MAG: hypothetical protein IPG72_14415 [Ardenticatenales bacterium]|nr:hypothetical protein [Ardenticatenales bacterium]